jgi:hypothetical protein
MHNTHNDNESFGLIEVFVWIDNQSTEGAEFVWVSECQKGEGCEIINQFVFFYSAINAFQCFNCS